MTKKDFQKELLENVTEGITSSTLKNKLKKSKSVDDIITPTPPTNLLQDQLNNKQQEVENLREQLETKNSNLTETSAELEQSLLARHKSLKDWFVQYSKNKELDQELTENIDQASTELISQDKKISKLSLENTRLKQEKQNLVRDYQLVSRLAESRKYPLPNQENNWDYFKYPLYSLVLVLFTLWLTNHLKK